MTGYVLCVLPAVWSCCDAFGHVTNIFHLCVRFYNFNLWSCNSGASVFEMLQLQESVAVNSDIFFLKFFQDERLLPQPFILILINFGKYLDQSRRDVILSLNKAEEEINKGNGNWCVSLSLSSTCLTPQMLLVPLPCLCCLPFPYVPGREVDKWS